MIAPKIAPRNGASRSRPCTFRAGFSMIEAVIAMVIVSGLVVASLNTVGAAQTRRARNANRARGHLLAHDLMTEILQQAYSDPNQSPTFGPESGETRATFDDIDDYFGYVDSPPTNKDGSAIELPAGWSRKVIVLYAEPFNLKTLSNTDKGAKIIGIEVSYNDATVYTLVAVRTSAWELNPS